MHSYLTLSTPWELQIREHRFLEDRKLGMGSDFKNGMCPYLNAREPTGQTLTHSAHWLQVDSTRGLPWKVETIRLKPRRVKPMAPIPSFSWHTHTHLPQRTHLLGS